MRQVAAWGAAHPGVNAVDGFRKEKLQELQAVTGRPLVVYAADFLSAKVAMTPQIQSQVQINLLDKDYMADVTANSPAMPSIS